MSSMSAPDGQPTLLEEVESMHRSLKELESVKGYIQVVQHALKLRYESFIVVRATWFRAVCS